MTFRSLCFRPLSLLIAYTLTACQSPVSAKPAQATSPEKTVQTVQTVTEEVNGTADTTVTAAKTEETIATNTEDRVHRYSLHALHYSNLFYQLQWFGHFLKEVGYLI